MTAFAQLPKAERAAIARRLRLEWACQGDRDAADGVLRMIQVGQNGYERRRREHAREAAAES